MKNRLGVDWRKRLKERIRNELPPLLFVPIALFYYLFHSRKCPFFVVPLSSFRWVFMTRNRKGILFAPEPVKYFGEVYWEYCDRGFMVERGDVVLDVGAWIGDFTIVAALKAGEEGRVISVEPHPFNLIFLKHNVSNLGNVTVIEKALWKRKGKMRLFQGSHSGGHSLIAGEEEHLKNRGSYVWVETETLDGLVSRLGLKRVDFLKMDVEGAELEILWAGKRTLEITRKIAIAAYHVRRGVLTRRRIKKMLEEYGFRTKVTKNSIVRGWKSF